MVIDSSALFAILHNESERYAFVDAIDVASVRLLSAATAVEAGIVALGREGEPGLEKLNALTATLGLQAVDFTGDHVTFALDAFRRFGKGRHPAGLNLGDCFSYALAKATGEPLLFKGDDFARTDIRRVL